MYAGRNRWQSEEKNRTHFCSFLLFCPRSSHSHWYKRTLNNLVHTFLLPPLPLWPVRSIFLLLSAVLVLIVANHKLFFPSLKIKANEFEQRGVVCMRRTRTYAHISASECLYPSISPPKHHHLTLLICFPACSI